MPEPGRKRKQPTTNDEISEDCEATKTPFSIQQNVFDAEISQHIYNDSPAVIVEKDPDGAPKGPPAHFTRPSTLNRLVHSDMSPYRLARPSLPPRKSAPEPINFRTTYKSIDFSLLTKGDVGHSVPTDISLGDESISLAHTHQQAISNAIRSEANRKGEFSSHFQNPEATAILLRAFLRGAHPILNIVSIPALLEEYQELSTGQLATSSQVSLLWATLYCGALSCSQSDLFIAFPQMTRKTLLQELLDLSSQALDHAGFPRNSDIASLTAFLLTNLCRIKSPCQNEIISTAIRISLKLGLHPHFSDDLNLSSCYDLHKKIWCLVLRLDTSVAISGGTMATLISGNNDLDKNVTWTGYAHKSFCTPNLTSEAGPNDGILCRIHTHAPRICLLSQSIERMTQTSTSITGISLMLRIVSVRLIK